MKWTRVTLPPCFYDHADRRQLEVLIPKLRLAKFAQAHVHLVAAPMVERDLDVIKGDTLRLLVMQDPLTWEQRPKVESGLEYEVIERFAREQGIPVNVIVATHRDSLLQGCTTAGATVPVVQLAFLRVHGTTLAWVRCDEGLSPRAAHGVVAIARCSLRLAGVEGPWPASDAQCAPEDMVAFVDASYHFGKGAARFARATC